MPREHAAADRAELDRVRAACDALGEAAFETLARMVETIPAARFTYPDSETGMAIVEQFAAEVGL